MRHARVIGAALRAFLLCVVCVACFGQRAPAGACADASDCDAGEACRENLCVAVCDDATDCEAGQVCTASGECVTPSGEAPTITAVQGNAPGTPTTVGDGLLVEGTGLVDATFALHAGSDTWGLSVRSCTDTQAELVLPVTVLSGTYTLSAVNGAGTGEATVTLELPEVTGTQIIDKINEAGTTGIIGAAHLPAPLDGTAIITAINAGGTLGSIDDGHLPTTLGSLPCGVDQTAVHDGSTWGCQNVYDDAVWFAATKTSDQSIGDVGDTIDFQSVRPGSATDFDTTNSWFEAPYDGVYLFTAWIHITGFDAGEVVMLEVHTGAYSQVLGRQEDAAAGGFTASVILTLSAGERVTLELDPATGDTVTVTGSALTALASQFNGVLLRRLGR